MEYLLFLNIFMLTRLGYLLKDGPIGATLGWLSCAVQLALVFILYQFDLWLVVLAAILLVATAVNLYAEKKALPLPGTRCLSFIVLALLSSICFQQSLAFYPWIGDGLMTLAAQSRWTSGFSASQWFAINSAVFGALFLTNEVNLLIRYGFYRLKLEPRQGEEDDGETDRNEYNAGRVIGILERYLMYTVILTSNSYSAIGFIIAAKGIARFKQMEQRHFAEYVLVGTLASTLSAIAIAALVQQLLSA